MKSGATVLNTHAPTFLISPPVSVNLVSKEVAGPGSLPPSKVDGFVPRNQHVNLRVQGYLVHKKTHPPGTLP